VNFKVLLDSETSYDDNYLNIL